MDNETQSELVGAIILIVDTGKFLRNTTSDVNGNFRFENISVGRHVIIFKYIGYKDRSIPIVLTSGKELVLVVELLQAVVQNKEVVIEAESEKVNLLMIWLR